MSNTNMCLKQKKMEMFTGEFLKREGYVTKVLLSDGNNYANELEVNITLNGYKRYYGSLEFQRDLMRYFNVSRGYSGRPYPWIGFASSRFNPPRREGCPSSSRENNFYFSFCLFFHNLQAQSIFILSGRDMMDRFHAETGVPMISCGLGGIMHPAHVLLEALYLY